MSINIKTAIAFCVAKAKEEVSRRGFYVYVKKSENLKPLKATLGERLAIKKAA